MFELSESKSLLYYDTSQQLQIGLFIRSIVYS